MAEKETIEDSEDQRRRDNQPRDHHDLQGSDVGRQPISNRLHAISSLRRPRAFAGFVPVAKGDEKMSLSDWAQLCDSLRGGRS
jgi:hypothetical protein